MLAGSYQHGVTDCVSKAPTQVIAKFVQQRQGRSRPLLSLRMRDLHTGAPLPQYAQVGIPKPAEACSPLDLLVDAGIWGLCYRLCLKWVHVRHRESHSFQDPIPPSCVTQGTLQVCNDLKCT